ncbi:MAG: ParB/Srx family N-terminal domain-containing protein [Pseudomonadota bacterium]
MLTSPCDVADELKQSSNGLHNSKQKTNSSTASKIEYCSVEDLTPNPRNARTHNRKQRRKLAASIKRLGFNNPILVDESYVLLAGHGRLLAAKDLGLSAVPVIVLDHMSDEEKRAYLLADNRIAQDAGWDLEILADEFAELTIALPDLDLDLAQTGFEDAEIDLIVEPIKKKLIPPMMST